MDSEQRSQLLFNVKLHTDPNVKENEAFIIGVDDKGQVFTSIHCKDPTPSKRKKRPKPDPLWDLEPHKVSFLEPDPAEPTRLYIDQDVNDSLIYTLSTQIRDRRLNGLWFDEGGYELRAPKITKNPDSFIHKCCMCGTKLDFINIICDKCLIRKTDTVVLEGDDIRQNDLILEG